MESKISAREHRAKLLALTPPGPAHSARPGAILVRIARIILEDESTGDEDAIEAATILQHAAWHLAHPGGRRPAGETSAVEDVN